MTAITCTFRDDPPNVVVDVTDMPAGTTTITVERIAEAGQSVVVRGADRVAVTGTDAWTCTDWDAPVGRDPVWRATMRNAGGGVLGTVDGHVWQGGDTVGDTVGDVVSDTVGGDDVTSGVPPITSGMAWISNPYDPLSAMLVPLMADSDQETTHSMDVSLSLAGRATHLPSAVVGVRLLGGKRTFTVRCWTRDQAQQLETLLTSAVTLLVRSQQIRHRTGCLFVVVGDVTEVPHHNRPAQSEATTWTLSCDEVDPGRIGVLVPPWTWAKSRAYVAAQVGKTEATWADRQAVFPLWIDATRGV